MGRCLKLDLGAAAGASPRPRSCQEVSLAFFLRGKGEMHLKAPFFPIFPLKAQPPNPARKAPNQHIPSSLGSGVLSRTGDTFGTAPPGRTWPILNKTSNKSVSTQLRCGGFHVKSSFYSPHSSFFFFFLYTPVSQCLAAGMGSHSPQSIYPWNAAASGRFLPLQLCTSAAKNTKFGLGTEAQNFCALTIQAWGLEVPLHTKTNKGCRERDEFVFPKRFPAVLFTLDVQSGDLWHQDKISDNQAVQEPVLSLSRQTEEVGK